MQSAQFFANTQMLNGISLCVTTFKFAGPFQIYQEKQRINVTMQPYFNPLQTLLINHHPTLYPTISHKHKYKRSHTLQNLLRHEEKVS